MLCKSLSLASAAFGVLMLGAATASAVTGVELIGNDSWRYGRFEARVQFAPGDGVVSTFFLWKVGSELADVFWNEIDFEKVGADCTSYSSNALYGQPESNHGQEITAGVDLCTGYHTHAVEWTPTYLIWLLDGVEVRRLTGADLQAFEDNALPGMQMRFNLWVGDANFGGNFSPGILPVHQYINWVSYSAYTPGAGEDGSDFSPTWREDFNAALGGSWSLGTWASPYGNSVYSPTNLTVVNGKAVMSLTADDALGFTGQAPVDPSDADSGNVGGAAGFGGTAGVGGIVGFGGVAGLGGAAGGAAGLGGGPELGGTPGIGEAGGVAGTSPMATSTASGGMGGAPPGVIPIAATGGAAPVAASAVPPVAMGGAPAAAPSSIPVATVDGPAHMATGDVPPATVAGPAPIATGGVAPTATTAGSANVAPVTSMTEGSEGCGCSLGARPPVFSSLAVFSLLVFGSWLRVGSNQRLSTKCKARNASSLIEQKHVP